MRCEHHGEQLTAVITALNLAAARIGVQRRRFPAGPVVGRGGAPRPPLPPRAQGPLYPGNGGNAGNLPYPTEVTSAPPERYMSEYAVMAAATKPPYSTLTAYDLNTGKILWQVPAGDHPPTIAAGGPTNTGGLALRTGIISTKAGLVFEAGGDGKLRVYDEMTGQVLWTGNFAGQSRGVPVMYESKGRQYFVMTTVANAPPVGVPGQPAAPAMAEGTPIGHVAWALPKK